MKQILIGLLLAGAVTACYGVSANAQQKEHKMQSFTEKNTIKFPTKEFMNVIGDISALSNIQTYIKIDDKIEEADQVLGLSEFIQQTPKNIKQINIDIDVDEQLSFKTQDNNSYKIQKIIDNELVDESDNTPFARQIIITVSQINIDNSKKRPNWAEINIAFFMKDEKNRIAQYTFINNLRNYNKPWFPYIKGPETLGTLSARNKHLEDGSLWWVYYNSYFRMESHNMPEQDVLQIAQWIYNHIEFTFND